MKLSASNIGKWIADYFRARCNAEDNLLIKDCRPTPGVSCNQIKLHLAKQRFPF